jgi:outer membrane biosynthesis protein TonB
MLLLAFFLILVSGSVFAAGLVLYLNSRSDTDSLEKALAEAPVLPTTTTPTATEKSTPKNKEKVPIPTVKDAEKIDKADPIKDKTPPPPAKEPEKKEEKKTDPKDPPPEKEPEKKEKNAPPPEEKTPPKEKEPVKPPPKVDSAEVVVRLVGKLENGTVEEKVNVIEQLSSLGEKARPAARALCQAALSPTKVVSRKALLALEQVAPQVAEQVFTLVVDGQAANHLKAIASLRAKGTEAKPAIPAMLFQIQKCEDSLKTQIAQGVFPGGWQARTLVDVINAHIIAIPEIAPESPEVLNAIIDTTKASFTSPVQGPPIANQDFVGFREMTRTPFRSTGIGLLGSLAGQRPEHRKHILPVLIEILNDYTRNLTNEDSVQPFQQPNLLASLKGIDSVGFALLECGPEAKAALAKNVIPKLKDLEFHKDAAVRNTAKDLRKRIEAGPAPIEESSPVKGRFEKQGVLTAADPFDAVRQRSHQKVHELRLVAGKTYQIDMVSNQIDSYLRLEDSARQRLAEDDDSGGFPNAHIIFSCRRTGTYRIICTTFQGGATGAYTLTVLER